ncbi:MAG: AMP-binding protein [Methylococcaceae bacterium]|nr:AMP-binding protein [Methylococcaceae bacterium]
MQSRGRLWSDARALAEALPDRPYLFNLCEDRYLFCLTQLAAMLRGQICLLPSSAQEGVLWEILRDYPEAYLAAERVPQHSPCLVFVVERPETGGVGEAPAFEDDRAALVAFTSGTTGLPKPCPHTWGTFRISARMALRSLGLERRRWLVVSTTPPQHMYGLETSVFWPLFSDLVLCPARPFFPEDIRLLVESSPLPVLLASTPTHLRALGLARGNWNNLVGILSATDQLSPRLARQMESATGAVLQEIYGSTETLSFATRATAHETRWRPYAGARLIQDGRGHTELISPHLAKPTGLQDRLRIETGGHFSLLGRSCDMVKVGGKRASLAELNRRLRDIEGVDDGLFYVREDERGECRLSALVVSSLDKQAIRQALRRYLDEVFLPRNIRFVAQIPRNPVGKVVKVELDKLLTEPKSADGDFNDLQNQLVENIMSRTQVRK